MKRRNYIGKLAAATASVFGWLPFTDDEAEPANQLQSYPLEHGADVDTPAGAHHDRPGAGAFLAEASNTFDLRVTQEEDTFTLAAASNGTHTFSMATDYDLAFPNTFLKVTGGVVSDVNAKPSGWVMNDDGTISGVEVVWANSSTSDQNARIEILGFEK